MQIELKKSSAGYIGTLVTPECTFWGEGRNKEDVALMLRASYIKSQDEKISSKEMYQRARDMNVDIIYK